MVGISTSVFNEASGLVRDWLKNPLNASFLYWYFLPSAGFILIQFFLIGPVLGRPSTGLIITEADASKGFMDFVLQILSAQSIALILVPLVAGVILSALAGTTLRLYQGTLAVTRPFFRFTLSRNQKRNSELYGGLHGKRREYLFLASQGVRLVNDENDIESAVAISEDERETLADELRAQIQEMHERIESASPSRELPVDPTRVGANDLANTLAVAEEYPFERYGMDAAVFWPRLSAEIEEKKLESLASSFAAMNGLLNLSFLIWLLGAESFVAAAVAFSGLTPFHKAPPLSPAWLFVVMIVSAILGFAAYRTSVVAARSVGAAMRTAFDYYRGDVLKRFRLEMPNDLDQERVMWLRLGAFIRRGEAFYYPSKSTSVAKGQ